MNDYEDLAVEWILFDNLNNIQQTDQNPIDLEW